ncbi:hypothetical protein C6I21_16005 [Alkalicoccus urumqiensis]|uniref:Uncharacterized protein n=1 Tax=Alkalicoccus urumqiensis TaxID=1548213 RepID=A0A2P6MD21_ALKUR|nr:hypothetical protein C6I21_16005 [Alkalicoccus urumqiensis]
MRRKRPNDNKKAAALKAAENPGIHFSKRRMLVSMEETAAFAGLKNQAAAGTGLYIKGRLLNGVPLPGCTCSRTRFGCRSGEAQMRRSLTSEQVRLITDASVLIT